MDEDPRKIRGHPVHGQRRSDSQPHRRRVRTHTELDHSTELAQSGRRARPPAQRRLGLNDVADPALLEACWPLHPLALLVLPELCQRYGQNERTLFSFLAGTEGKGVRSWLEETTTGRRATELPSIGLSAVYEYFVDSAANLAGVSTAASRWLEVETRIRDAHGLNAGQRRVVRAVGLLNLVASGGSLRASRALVKWAAADGDAGTQSEDAVRRRLSELERAGLLTFRDFADEYRVWQGSDFDLRGAIDAARSRVLSESLANVLERVRPLGPVIAGRHSHESGTLRSFARHWADSDTLISAHDTSSAVDGSVYFVLDDRDPAQVVTEEGAKPVVLSDVGASRRPSARPPSNARHSHEALRSGDQISDWVAERELRERLDESITKFDQAFDATFGSRANGVAWQMARPGKKPQEIPAATASSALSWVCDRVYDQAPRVRNDLINRRELTSQAAKARRMLLEAMLRPDRPRLGIEGFGPERAMYEALLAATGIHREDRGAWRLHRPTPKSGCQPVWDHIVSRFHGCHRRTRQHRRDLRDPHQAAVWPTRRLRAGHARGGTPGQRRPGRAVRARHVQARGHRRHSGAVGPQPEPLRDQVLRQPDPVAAPASSRCSGTPSRRDQRTACAATESWRSWPS